MGLGDVAGNLVSIFVLLAGDLTRLDVRAAFGLGWASLAGQLQRALAGYAFAGGSSVRV